MPGPYPKTFYHPDGRHVECKDANAEAELGNDWYDDARIADHKRSLTDADIAILRGRMALIEEQDAKGQGHVYNSHMASQSKASGYGEPAMPEKAFTEQTEPSKPSPALTPQ